MNEKPCFVFAGRIPLRQFFDLAMCCLNSGFITAAVKKNKKAPHSELLNAGDGKWN